MPYKDRARLGAGIAIPLQILLGKPFDGQGLVVFSSPGSQGLISRLEPVINLSTNKDFGFRELLNTCADNIPANSQVPDVHEVERNHLQAKKFDLH